MAQRCSSEKEDKAEVKGPVVVVFAPPTGLDVAAYRDLELVFRAVCDAPLVSLLLIRTAPL